LLKKIVSHNHIKKTENNSIIIISRRIETVTVAAVSSGRICFSKNISENSPTPIPFGVKKAIKLRIEYKLKIPRNIKMLYHLTG